MQIIWLCLKMGYTPQMVILMGIMIIGGFMAFKQTHIYIGSLAGVCLSSALSSLSLSQPVSSTHQPKHTTNNSTRPIVDKNNNVQTKYINTAV